MAVKRNLSAGRMLAVFETIARAQPVGVSALARELGADKSAVQRDLMTLADAGWIAGCDAYGWFHVMIFGLNLCAANWGPVWDGI